MTFHEPIPNRRTYVDANIKLRADLEAKRRWKFLIGCFGIGLVLFILAWRFGA